ncbi:CLU domain containing protein like protein, partial [Aduncisulcus paluster]
FYVLPSAHCLPRDMSEAMDGSLDELEGRNIEDEELLIRSTAFRLRPELVASYSCGGILKPGFTEYHTVPSRLCDHCKTIINEYSYYSYVNPAGSIVKKQYHLCENCYSSVPALELAVKKENLIPRVVPERQRVTYWKNEEGEVSLTKPLALTPLNPDAHVAPRPSEEVGKLCNGMCMDDVDMLRGCSVYLTDELIPKFAKDLDGLYLKAATLNHSMSISKDEHLQKKEQLSLTSTSLSATPSFGNATRSLSASTTVGGVLAGTGMCSGVGEHCSGLGASDMTPIPSTGDELVAMMEEWGIDERYLGAVCSASECGAVRELCEREMLARVICVLIRDGLSYIPKEKSEDVSQDLSSSLASDDVPEEENAPFVPGDSILSREFVQSHSKQVILHYLNEIFTSDIHRETCVTVWDYVSEVCVNKYNYPLSVCVRDRIFLQGCVDAIFKYMGVEVHPEKREGDGETTLIDFATPFPFGEDIIHYVHPRISVSVSIPLCVSETVRIHTEARESDMMGKRSKWWISGGPEREEASQSYVELLCAFSEANAGIMEILEKLGISLETELGEVSVKGFTPKDEKQPIEDEEEDQVEQSGVAEESVQEDASEYDSFTLPPALSDSLGAPLLKFASLLLEAALQLKSRHEENGRREYSRWNRCAGIPPSCLSKKAREMLEGVKRILGCLINGRNSGEMVLALRSIAELSHKQSRVDDNTECIDTMNECCDVCVRCFGFSHPITAEQYLATALMLRDGGDAEGAAPFVRRSFVILCELYGCYAEPTQQCFRELKKIETVLVSGLEDIDAEEMVAAIEKVEMGERVGEGSDDDGRDVFDVRTPSTSHMF